MDEKTLRKRIRYEESSLSIIKGRSGGDQNVPTQIKIEDVPLETRKRDADQPLYLERYE